MDTDPRQAPPHRAFESPFREDRAPAPAARQRTRYAGRATLAAVVLLAIVAALILLI
jgi:hypothetical protein